MPCRPSFATLALGSFFVAGALSGCSGDSSEPAPSSKNGSSPSGGATSGTGNPTKGVPQNAETDPDEVASGTVDTNCTGEAGTFYGLSVKKLGGGSDLPLCAYRNHVVLLVNGASGCGYTPQYKPLETLYEKYKETQGKPFEIIAFPSDSFNQEKDTDQQVSEFCTTEYHITFPLTTIGPVVDDTAKGATAQPVYQWLYKQAGFEKAVAWNFEKFLIGKDGKVVKRWLSATSPDPGGEIDLAIAAELAK